MTSEARRRRLGLALFALVVPWVVQSFSRGPPAFVFAWGLAGIDPLSVTDLYSFLFVYTSGLPDWILVWPVGVLCYALGLASVVGGVVTGREDRRLTAGLFALAGVAVMSLAWGFSGQPGRVGLPVGTVVLWVVAYVCRS